MSVQRTVLENGKIQIVLRKFTSGVSDKFKFKSNHMFIREFKTNSNDRRFGISIRTDGVNGDYRLAQISLSYDELSEIKNEIENLLKC